MNEKLKKVLQGLLFIAIIAAFIYIGTRDFSEKVIVDNERFDQEYQNVSKNNVFVYASSQEVYTKLKNGNAIIFMGFKDNPWSGYYANILNETAKNSGIKEILYYDFEHDRDNKNATYQSIVLNLSEYLPTLDDGKQNIYAPTLVVIKNGKIIAFDNETAITTGKIDPEEYWNKTRMGIKINSFSNIFATYLNN